MTARAVHRECELEYRCGIGVDRNQQLPWCNDALPSGENVFQIDAPSGIQFEGLVVSAYMKQGSAQSKSWKAMVVPVDSVDVLSATSFYQQCKIPQILASHRQQASALQNNGCLLEEVIPCLGLSAEHE